MRIVELVCGSEKCANIQNVFVCGEDDNKSIWSFIFQEKIYTPTNMLPLNWWVGKQTFYILANTVHDIFTIICIYMKFCGTKRNVLNEKPRGKNTNNYFVSPTFSLVSWPFSSSSDSCCHQLLESTRIMDLRFSFAANYQSLSAAEHPKKKNPIDTNAEKCWLDHHTNAAQEPMKTKAPQLHMEYRFYRILGSHGKCSNKQ